MGDINALTEDIFLKKDEEEKLQIFYLIWLQKV